jgi:hypothetical protein
VVAAEARTNMRGAARSCGHGRSSPVLGYFRLVCLLVCQGHVTFGSWRAGGKQIYREAMWNEYTLISGQY